MGIALGSLGERVSTAPMNSADPLRARELFRARIDTKITGQPNHGSQRTVGTAVVSRSVAHAKVSGGSAPAAEAGGVRELSRSSRGGNPMRGELTSPVIRYEITLMNFRIAIIASEMVFGGEMLQ